MQVRPPSPAQAAIAQVAGWLAEAGPERVTVLTGAGISTDSGIPDFRGPQGIWTKDPSAQRLFDLRSYLEDRELRVSAWQRRREHPAWSAEPNPGHRALVDLERSGRLAAVVTQNIDGLHQRAGQSADRVLEIHGSIHACECVACGWRGATTAVLARVAAGEPDPPCEQCGGILKTATISFGQSLRREVLRACVRAAKACDLFLAVGSSLTVQPAASLVEVALDAGARVVVVNAAPTAYDRVAAVRLSDPIGAVLPALVAPTTGR
jgi:NAD-dependent deacetylase